jgi:phosphate transport system protein
MREQFQEELNSVSATLVAMAGLVKTAMENATTALLTADSNER